MGAYALRHFPYFSYIVKQRSTHRPSIIPTCKGGKNSIHSPHHFHQISSLNSVNPSTYFYVFNLLIFSSFGDSRKDVERTRVNRASKQSIGPRTTWPPEMAGSQPQISQVPPRKTGNLTSLSLPHPDIHACTCCLAFQRHD